MNGVENVDIVHLEQLADSLIESDDQLLKSLISMRKKHNLTQDVVAERMGVSQPTVAAFERYDANPTLSSIRRYALAVGANVQHQVEDACCRLDADDFIAIVAPTTATWDRRPRVDWSWSAGPAIVETNVFA